MTISNNNISGSKKPNGWFPYGQGDELNRINGYRAQFDGIGLSPIQANSLSVAMALAEDDIKRLSQDGNLPTKEVENKWAELKDALNNAKRGFIDRIALAIVDFFGLCLCDGGAMARNLLLKQTANQRNDFLAAMDGMIKLLDKNEVSPEIKNRFLTALTRTVDIHTEAGADDEQNADDQGIIEALVKEYSFDETAKALIEQGMALDRKTAQSGSPADSATKDESQNAVESESPATKIEAIQQSDDPEPAANAEAAQQDSNMEAAANTEAIQQSENPKPAEGATVDGEVDTKEPAAEKPAGNGPGETPRRIDQTRLAEKLTNLGFRNANANILGTALEGAQSALEQLSKNPEQNQSEIADLSQRLWNLVVSIDSAEIKFIDRIIIGIADFFNQFCSLFKKDAEPFLFRQYVTAEQRNAFISALRDLDDHLQSLTDKSASDPKNPSAMSEQDQASLELQKKAKADISACYRNLAKAMGISSDITEKRAKEIGQNYALSEEAFNLICKHIVFATENEDPEPEEAEPGADAAAVKQEAPQTKSEVVETPQLHDAGNEESETEKAKPAQPETGAAETAQRATPEVKSEAVETPQLRDAGNEESVKQEANEAEAVVPGADGAQAAQPAAGEGDAAQSDTANGSPSQQ